MLNCNNFLYKIYFKFISFLIKKSIIGHPSKISLLQIISCNSQIAKKKVFEYIGETLSNKIYLRDNIKVLLGKGKKFSNSETVIVAHWDPDNIIDPYVLYFLKKFKKAGKKVILCSANFIKNKEKLDFIDAVIYRTCPGYDFSSWKCIFEVFPSLYEAKEVTFTNDSIFMPIGKFEEVYETMKSIECDFWGMTLSRGGELPHLQSFFLVFREKALTHSSFKKFIVSISNGEKRMAVKYEFLFSIWLELNGLQAACYRPYFKFLPFKTNPMSFWSEIICDGIPLLKRTLLNNLANNPNCSQLLKEHDYPQELFFNYCKRMVSTQLQSEDLISKAKFE